MECEACDCTRAIKLPGKSLVGKLDIQKEEILGVSNNNSFVDMAESVLIKENKEKELKHSDMYSMNAI